MSRRGKAAAAGDVELANAEADAEVKRRDAEPKIQEEGAGKDAGTRGRGEAATGREARTQKHAKRAATICLKCNDQDVVLVAKAQVIPDTKKKTGGVLCVDCTQEALLAAVREKVEAMRDAVKKRVEGRSTPLLDDIEAEPAVDSD